MYDKLSSLSQDGEESISDANDKLKFVVHKHDERT